MGYDAVYMVDFWEWDQATNVWTQKSSLPGASRAFAAGFSIGTKGYIGSGFNGAYLNDFWEWDQATNTWTQKANLSTNFSHSVGLSIGNKGYFATGFNGTSTSFLYEWDQATNIWTQKTSLPGPARAGASGFSIGSKLFVANGSNVGTYYNDLYEWNQSTDTWTQKANYGGLPVYQSKGFAIGNWGYTGTGNDQTGVDVANFWLYDPPSDTWLQKALYGGLPVHYATAFSIGNKGYLGTGQASGAVNIFWEYTPDSVTTGVSDLYAGDKGLTLLPNPATEFIEVTTFTAAGLAEVKLTDATGKQVFTTVLIHIKKELMLHN